MVAECFQIGEWEFEFVRYIAVVGGSVLFLMKKDVRDGSNMLRQNLKTIRGWMEETSASATKYFSAPFSAYS